VTIVFAAGETVTAAKLNRLQPSVYSAVGSGVVAASSTGAPVTGASVTFTTLQANATYVAHTVFDVDLIGSTTVTLTARLYVDGAAKTPLATYAAQISTDRATVPQNYSGTLAAAGSHTLDIRVTTGANQNVQGVNSSIVVVIYEQN
jgi:hypothetical protein